MKPWQQSLPVAGAVRVPRRMWTNTHLWVGLACLLVLNAVLGGPPSLLPRGAAAIKPVQLATEAAAAGGTTTGPAASSQLLHFNAMDPAMTGGISVVAPAMDAEPCSSCEIQAAVSAAETAVAMTLGVNVSVVDLSEQDLQYCSPVKVHSCTEDASQHWQLKDALKQLYFWQALQGKCLPLPDKRSMKKSTHNSENVCASRVCDDTNTIVTNGEFSFKVLQSSWQIQQQIRTFGSAPAVMEIYSDFDTFFAKPANRKAVYVRSANTKVTGARAVLIVGYSIVGKYYVIRDCKGTAFADNGVVKVASASANFRSVFGVGWVPKSVMVELPAPWGTATSRETQQPASSAPGELEALQMIKSDMDPTGIALTDWSLVNSASNTEEKVYCRWRGIFCNSKQQVTQINLSNIVDNLSGTLPGAWVLQQLPALTHFLVGPSQRLHGDLPDDWSELSNLQEIAVIDTSVSGGIPDSWGSGLKNLRRLRLWKGRFDWGLPSSLSGLQNLQELQLSGNKFAGTLPASWAALSQLKDLRLADNALKGTVPLSWGQGMKSLREIHLESNKGLTGCLPPQFAAKMTKGMLANTGLTGFCSKGDSKPSNR